MKKLVGIVLTTGLLMGTVAFGALACDRDDSHNRFQEQEQKRMEQHEQYQSPVKPRGHKDKVIVKVEVEKPSPVPAPRVRRPAPFLEHDHRFMPQMAPDRHDHDRRPVNEKSGWDDDFRR